MTGKRFSGADGLEFVQYVLPMDQGWAFYAWDIENDGWLAFNGVRRQNPGYIAQEIEKLLEAERKRKNSNGKQAHI